MQEVREEEKKWNSELFQRWIVTNWLRVSYRSTL